MASSSSQQRPAAAGTSAVDGGWIADPEAGNPGKRRVVGFAEHSPPVPSFASSAASAADAWRVPSRPFARSPVAGNDGSSVGSSLPFLFEGGPGGLGAAMQEAVERSLPPTPRSPSPTCSPPSSPKRQAQKTAQDEGKPGEMSAAEEDLETRAAALGLHEIERRVWKENALPPTPSAPSPTVSPPSSPKTQQRQAELALLTANEAAVKVRSPGRPLETARVRLFRRRCAVPGAPGAPGAPGP